MPKIICNTTPILSLLKIEQLHLLALLYSTIIIPEAVLQEIETGKGGLYYTDLASLTWVDIKTIQNPITLQYLTDVANLFTTTTYDIVCNRPSQQKINTF